MSNPTPIHVRVEDRPDGSRRVTLGCRCASLSWTGPAWEPLEDVVYALRSQHRIETPLCQHPWVPALRRTA